MTCGVIHAVTVKLMFDAHVVRCNTRAACVVNDYSEQFFLSKKSERASTASRRAPVNIFCEGGAKAAMEEGLEEVG